MNPQATTTDPLRLAAEYEGSVLQYMEETLDLRVPGYARAWALSHIAPEQALEDACTRHLLWLAGVAGETRGARSRSLQVARGEAYAAYLRTQDDGATQEETRALAGATTTLRLTLEASRWWNNLRIRWDFDQTQGLGTVGYWIGRGKGRYRVRGTRVGNFAIREYRIGCEPILGFPPLRHFEQTPRHWYRAGGPERMYAVCYTPKGLSLGSYMTAGVAFEVARRFNEADVPNEPINATLQRLLDTYQGPPPPTSLPSWPARPPARYLARYLRLIREEEVSHAI